jgi:hypothetical protein
MARALRLLSVILLVGCAAPEDAPVRSPARDYRPEPVRTADGQVLGADGKDPSALLEESGTTEQGAPGWTLGEDGLKYDPKRPAGHSDQAEVPPEHEHDPKKGKK